MKGRAFKRIANFYDVVMLVLLSNLNESASLLPGKESAKLKCNFIDADNGRSFESTRLDNMRYIRR